MNERMNIRADLYIYTLHYILVNVHSQKTDASMENYTPLHLNEDT